MNRTIAIIILLCTIRPVIRFAHTESYWSQMTDSAAIQLEPRVQIGHQISKVKISPDGRYALTWTDGAASSFLAMWDVTSGKIIRLLPARNKGANFSEFEPYIVYAQTYMPRGNVPDAIIAGLEEVWDMRTGKKIGYTSTEPYAEYTRKNTQVASPYYAVVDSVNGTCEIYSVNTQTRISSLNIRGGRKNGNIVMSPDSSKLLFTGHEPFIWDIENACVYSRLPFRDYLLTDTNIVFSNAAFPQYKQSDGKIISCGWKPYTSGIFLDDTHILLGAYNGKMTRWTIEGQLEGEISLSYPIAWTPIYDEQYRRLYASTNYGLHCSPTGVNLNELTELKQVLPVPSRYSVLYDAVLSPRDNRIYMGGDAGLYYVNRNQPKEILHADSAENRKKWVMPVCLCMSPDKRHLLVGSDGMRTYSYTIGEPAETKVRYSSDATIRACAFLDNTTFVVGTYPIGRLEFFRLNDKKCFRKIDAHSGGVRSITVDHKRRLIYTAGVDTEFKVWSLDNFNLVATVVPLTDDNYIIYTPDGYFKTSQGAATHMMFGRGLKLYDFEQFDLQYNRPDIVMSRLGADQKVVKQLYAAYLKRLKRNGFTEGQLNSQFEAPTVQMRHPTQTAVNVAKQTIEVDMSSPKSSIRQIHVWINGSPVIDSNTNTTKARLTKNLTIELTPGQNHVEVSCTNAHGIESMRESWNVVLTSPTNIRTRYIVAMGVSQYNVSGYNLKYPVKDAKDIVDLFAQTGSENGVVVKSLLLTDRQVNKSVLAQIRSWLAGAKREDEVIFYYAGHGLLSKEADYYLATCDMDFNHPQVNGISYDFINALLGRITPLKRFMMIDACHAGEVDKEDLAAAPSVATKQGAIRFRGAAVSFNDMLRQSQEITQLMDLTFADIRRSSGSTTLVSSSGMEVAVEGDNWGNGLFTYAIKNAMERAEADKDKDGYVSIRELADYISQIVPKLSNGAQHPVLRNANHFNDLKFSVKP